MLIVGKGAASSCDKGTMYIIIVPLEYTNSTITRIIQPTAAIDKKITPNINKAVLGVVSREATMY